MVSELQMAEGSIWTVVFRPPHYSLIRSPSVSREWSPKEIEFSASGPFHVTVPVDVGSESL